VKLGLALVITFLQVVAIVLMMVALALKLASVTSAAAAWKTCCAWQMTARSWLVSCSNLLQLQLVQLLFQCLNTQLVLRRLAIEAIDSVRVAESIINRISRMFLSRPLRFVDGRVHGNEISNFSEPRWDLSISTRLERYCCNVGRVQLLSAEVVERIGQHGLSTANTRCIVTVESCLNSSYTFVSLSSDPNILDRFVDKGDLVYEWVTSVAIELINRILAIC